VRLPWWREALAVPLGHDPLAEVTIRHRCHACRRAGDEPHADGTCRGDGLELDGRRPRLMAAVFWVPFTLIWLWGAIWGLVGVPETRLLALAAVPFVVWRIRANRRPRSRALASRR
jgi:hypothetical protein